MRLPVMLFLSATTLVGCVQAPVADQPPPATAPVTISQSQLATVGKAVLAGLEAAAANYALSSGITPAQQAAIVRAEVQCENDVGKLLTAKPEALSNDMIAAQNSIQAFVSAIPAGRIPASVTAGVSAFTVLVTTVAPLLASPPTVPAAPGMPAKTQAVKLVA